MWKGTISFGLVTIPISLFPAIKREELKFRLLRASDLSPINYKRVAEADGKEVGWDEIVKGYEYEKGKLIVLKDEDFARVDIEATQTVDIVNFVSLSEINPLLFYKPYHMQVEKGGDKAYALLREALSTTGTVGIAKVVIKTRQHLAAVKPQNNLLILELMHFAEELVETDEFKAPSVQNFAKNEMDMAKQLISSMSQPWNPDQYRDEYQDALKELVEKKIESGGEELPAPKARKPAGNVIDLVSVLQESVNQAKRKDKPTSEKSEKQKPAAKRPSPRKKAA